MPRRESPSEAQIQRKILSHLNALSGCWAVKYPAALRRGVPDVLCCYKGTFVALEVKRPGCRPTALQRAVIEQITDAGGLATVVTSVEEAVAVLNAGAIDE